MEEKTDRHSVLSGLTQVAGMLSIFMNEELVWAIPFLLKKKIKTSQKGSPFIAEVSVPPLSWLYPCALLKQDYKEEERFTL